MHEYARGKRLITGGSERGDGGGRLWFDIGNKVSSGGVINAAYF